MTINIYSIFDRGAQAYLDPWYAPNDDVAIRSMSIAAADPGSNFHRFPEDYSLYAIGEFNPKTGIITTGEGPRHVITAEQVRVPFSVSTEVSDHDA